MKVPNKFLFYHHSDESIIYFATKDESEYVISGGDLQSNTTFLEREVDGFVQCHHWVLTVPSKFKVRGLVTGSIYDLCKDANNLYVMGIGQSTLPILHREEEVFDSLYGENPVWEVYTEEKVEEQIKELTTPDTFKFRHCSDCEHNGLIFSAKRYKNSYWITWFDRDTGEERVTEYLATVVEEYLDGGLWIIVEETLMPALTKEQPKKLISINVNSARAAAEFDVANNKHTIKKGLSVEEIEQEILKYVREMYSGLMSGEFEWESRAIGTRSYTVHFQVEDENYGVISVEVDPSTGMPAFFADVNDFLSQN